MSSFPAIRIEGGLLGPELLDEIVTAKLPGQRPTDFGLEPRRNLTDEIAAAFADARSLWNVFQNRLARIPEDDLATTLTRDSWVIPFLGLLGYELRYNQKAFEVDGLTFAVSHRAGEPEDSPVVHIVGVRQELGRLAPSGRPRLAPHSLVQEYLNRTEHLWGLVTNGETLRLLRDSTFIRRQSYIEFDLRSILDDQRYLDFAALYRLLHRTRLPRGIADADQCLLEQYHAHSIEQGGRVREHLRDGVEQCITILANGFLSHPRNEELRRQVNEGRLSAGELYRQLLRLIYRFLFLLVSEDRGLISPNPIYHEHYGIARLRRLLDSRSAFTDHDDLWNGLRVLWRVFGDEDMAAILRLAPLNGELFTELRALDTCHLSNRDLLSSFWHLAYYREGATAPATRVNYAAMDVEELGSVYESLLEFHPAFEMDGLERRKFLLVTGSERKTTGSYYTPQSLVSELIQSALEPVMADRIATAVKSASGGTEAERKAAAILGIKVCDPACGSGAFLLTAARRMGKELARVRTGEMEPAPERVREATREVIAHCIYGVDKNPLAVDLCRVALWIESHVANKPLTFLDHRIRVGDSLVGVFDLSVLKDGIPDKAFEPLAGDDKEAARQAARQNREDKKRRFYLAGFDPRALVEQFHQLSEQVDQIADDSPGSIQRKKQLYENRARDKNWARQKRAADMWTAAFFQLLKSDRSAITSDAIYDVLADRPLDARLTRVTDDFAFKLYCFHWPLEFPEVFAAGGFDVVLSNPPWERLKLQEQEFFAARDARIAGAPNKAARGRLIAELQRDQPGLYSEYEDAIRAAEGASLFARQSGRFSLTGRGDINTYAVFSELNRALIKPAGRAGFIVPTGIATDDTTKYFFGDLVGRRSLVSLYDFENRKRIFPAVDSRMKFCLLTLTNSKSENDGNAADFVFFAQSVADLRDPERHFSLSPDEFALLNPNTGNCPIFRSRRDAELTKAIYRRVPVLWKERTPESNPWNLQFSRMFDMANDSEHFRTAEELRAQGCRLEGNIFVGPDARYLPLYEAKMIHQFDHRWATYEDAGGEPKAREVTAEEKRDPNFVVQPRYWVREDLVAERIPRYPEPLAMALKLGHKESVQAVLCLWAAGYHFVTGDVEAGAGWITKSYGYDLHSRVSGTFRLPRPEQNARGMADLFALRAEDIARIRQRLADPWEIADGLVERFSPKWLLGWRDITNATNERTVVSAILPCVAVGDKVLLFFTPLGASEAIALHCAMNSFVLDYCARQKLGSTSLKYFIMRQLPMPTPDALRVYDPTIRHTSVNWCASRTWELVYTANDLASVPKLINRDSATFPWNAPRRFEIRCELDAQFFRIYLPSTADGQWAPAEGETDAQLSALTAAFPTPREAVCHILDSFPIVRQKDEAAYGSYRSKDRILAIYDAMLEAQRTGRPYQSPLDPPPGVS